jgi:hypothetical protein
VTAPAKGRIFWEPWVSCGVCGGAESVAPGRNESASDETIRMGYRRSARFGWVCPECSKSGREALRAIEAGQR